MSEQRLLCPFLDQSSAFTQGVEFGMLVAKMRKAKKVSDYFLLANQDQILLAASRLGWEICNMKVKGDWVWIRMKKRPGCRDTGTQG
jgi:hypothetical protein